FELHYTALSFRIPERVLFKYKLEGFDQSWVDAETRRAAYYTNLSPGKYSFRVKACNDDGIWNEAGASFAFSLQPHFYQSWWFLALCAMSLVAAIVGGHRIRVRQLEAKERELEEIVDQR